MGLSGWLGAIVLGCLAACAVGPSKANDGQDASTNDGADASTGGPDGSVTCPENHSAVGGQCVDFAIDNNHCGKPDNTCSATTICLGGSCTLPTPMPTAVSQSGATLGPDGKIYLIGGGGDAGLLSIVQVYDPRTNAWTTVQSIPVKFNGVAVTTRDGTIHAIDDRYHSTYDVRSNTWTEQPRLPATENFSGATLASDGRIVVVGGARSGAQFSNSAVANDPATKIWKPLPAMPHARTAYGNVVAANGLVYVVGGTGMDGAATSVDAYNPTLNSWSTMSGSPPALIGGTVAAPDGKTVYVRAVLSFYFYDTVENRWTKQPNPIPSSNASSSSGMSLVVTSDGRAFAMGGGLYRTTPNSETRVTRAVQVYDPKRGTWIASAP